MRRFSIDRRHGFTLVELVVVVLILGILSAVAAPKLLNVSGTGTDNGLRQTLSVIRDAIERYAADNAGALPGADKNQVTAKADLAKYLRTFPENPVGQDSAKLDQIKMRDQGDPLSGHTDNNEGWIYDNSTGEFRANVDGLSNDGVTPYSDF